MDDLLHQLEELETRHVETTNALKEPTIVSTFLDGTGPIILSSSASTAVDGCFGVPFQHKDTLPLDCNDDFLELHRSAHRLRENITTKERTWTSHSPASILKHHSSHLAYQLPIRESRWTVSPFSARRRGEEKDPRPPLRSIIDQIQYTFQNNSLDEGRHSDVNDVDKHRKPQAMEDYARGKVGNRPFRAGGITLSKNLTDDTLNEKKNVGSTVNLILPFDPDTMKENVSGNQTPYEVSAPGIHGGPLTQEQCHKFQSEEVHVEESDGSRHSDRGSSVLQAYAQCLGTKDQLFSWISSAKEEKDIQKQIQASLGKSNDPLFSLPFDKDDDLGLYADDEEKDVTDDDHHSTAGAPALELAYEETTTSSIKIPMKAIIHDNSSTGAEEIDQLLQLEKDENTQARSTKHNNGQNKTLQWAFAAPTNDPDAINRKFSSLDLAMSFPFELDMFQKQAVLSIEQQECIFVAAHTSAGKTVVAEYAIAQSQKHMTRTVYTSPIKALSNQKFRDFRSKFGPDVGLITGDVSISPEASCLVMTTEILRSMLYRGADLLRDIEWVIFDEIHYINSTERGVVWEEVIIMLPDHINLIFLSATSPNTFEFSDWVGRTKQKKIQVISTFKRPVPLQHYLYAKGDLFKIMDQSNQFLPAGHSAAAQKLRGVADDSLAKNHKNKTSAKSTKSSSSGGGRRFGGDKSEWISLLRSLEKKQLLPVVVFAFSKRLIEQCAGRLSSLNLLNSAQEKYEIDHFVTQSIRRLQGSDQTLPQVLRLKEMLLRGIGIHHGGLLPILKEIVEMLFSRGLVKVLFSTETFAMGVNMPARSVVFQGVQKHDGQLYRYLSPGEYTQMAGRAGRRGLDSVGTVILCCWGTDELSNQLPLSTLSTMLLGEPTKLTSQFRLTYTMILNLFRVEDMTVEDMIKRSFSEFHSQKELSRRNVPRAMDRAKALLEKLQQQYQNETFCIRGGALAIEDYYQRSQESHVRQQHVFEFILASKKYSSRVFCPGRLVWFHLRRSKAKVLGMILRVETKMSVRRTIEDRSTRTTMFHVFTLHDDHHPHQSFVPGPGPGLNTKQGQVMEIQLDQMDLISALVCPEKINVIDLIDRKSEQEWMKIQTFVQCLDLDTQHHDPSSSGGGGVFESLSMTDIPEFDFIQLNAAFESLRASLRESKCHECPQQQPMYELMDQLTRVQRHYHYLEHALSNDNLSLFPDFLQRVHVLEELGYIDAQKTIQLKGRVACEINTSDELVLTEMIFENIFADLSPAECVAICSPLIFQQKSSSSSSRSTPATSGAVAKESMQDETVTTVKQRSSDSEAETLATDTAFDLAQAKLRSIIQSLGVLQFEAELDLDVVEYMESFNFELLEVVYEWANGRSFLEICEHTDIQEGTIVRCITRLDEVCKEVQLASKLIGDSRLFRKMEKASELST